MLQILKKHISNVQYLILAPLEKKRKNDEDLPISNSIKVLV